MPNRLPCTLLLAVAALAQTPDYLKEGEAALQSGKRKAAVESLEKAVQNSPSDPMAHSLLAVAHESLYTPGVNTRDSLTHAEAAEREYRTVYTLRPDDLKNLERLASLQFKRGNDPLSPDPHRFLDDSAYWYNRILSIQPDNLGAHYGIGLVAWRTVYPELISARAQTGLRPEDPGPLPDASLRVSLHSRFRATLDDGIRHLERAVELNPENLDAMAYLNLLHRQRADLSADGETYKQDIRIADNWARKATEAGRRAPIRPPQSASGAPQPSADPPRLPTQIRVGANVQAAKLIQSPPPQYPALAKQARIQGIVRLDVLIGKDGIPGPLKLVSGHPLLVPAAFEAVQGYRYQPTLLNGVPVDVLTEVNVAFTLPEQQ